MNWKKVLTELLIKIGILTKDTKEINIYCNDGTVSDVKRVERIK